MGLSVSASSAILFVAFVVVFGALFGAVTEYYHTMDDVTQVNEDRLMASHNTAIEFYSMDESNDSFTIINTGSETLNISDFEVLINGTLLETGDYQVVVMDHLDSRLIFSGEKAHFTMNEPIADGQIMVVTAWGFAITYSLG